MTVHIMIGAPGCGKSPWFWYGTENRISLYLVHPDYSPFWDWDDESWNRRGKKLTSREEWEVPYDSIPEGQKELVDKESLIPLALLGTNL